MAPLEDPLSCKNMQNAIGILKLISQGEEDIETGKSKSQEAVFKGIEHSLEEKLRMIATATEKRIQT